MSKEFVNDYGADVVSIRKALVKCEHTFEALTKNNLVKEAGILQLKMLSEIVLLLSSERESVPFLVQQVRKRWIKLLGDYCLFATNQDANQLTN